MKPNSRHAKPSMKVLAPRIDRKLNILVKHVPTLLDHCQRLLREKEILQGENETLKRIIELKDRRQLMEAAAFMAMPGRKTA